MPELAAKLLLVCLAALPLALLVPVLGRRYMFSRDGLTVVSLWILQRRTITFDQLRLEAVGTPRQELPRLRERLPGCRAVDLTRSWLPGWSVCGFVSTPDALLILPHSVARALISRNPPARWALMRAETRRRLADLPQRTLQAWPRQLRVGYQTASLLLLGMSLLQIVCAAVAMWSLYHHYLRLHGVTVQIVQRAMAELAVYQLSGPLLVLGCGSWLAGIAWTRRKPPALLLALTFAAVWFGGALAGKSSHELSHAWREDCTSYDDMLGACLGVGLACCGVMIGGQWLERLASRERRSPLPVE